MRRGRALKIASVTTAAGNAKHTVLKGTRSLASITSPLTKPGRGTLTLKAKSTKALKRGSYKLRLSFTATSRHHRAHHQTLTDANLTQSCRRSTTSGATISALTVCGLHHGVLAATDAHRPGRLALLAWVERTFRPLAVDERVAPSYARLARAAHGAGRDVRRGTADLLIAATADAHGLVLLTRDETLARLESLNAELV